MWVPSVRPSRSLPWCLAPFPVPLSFRGGALLPPDPDPPIPIGSAPLVMTAMRAHAPGETPGEQHVVELTALDVPESIREHFWALASYTPEERVDAASELARAWASHGEDDGGGGGGGAHSLSPIQRYVLRRLAKGVCSGRTMARHGFSVALAAVFEQVSRDTDKKACAVRTAALEIVDAAAARAPKSAKGGDARDALIGRVFGLSAVARGLVAKRADGKKVTLKKADREAVASSAGWVLERLAVLAADKSFLAEPCAAAALDLLVSVARLDASAAAGAADAAPAAVARWFDGAGDATNALWLQLALRGKVPASFAKRAFSLLPAESRDEKGNVAAIASAAHVGEVLRHPLAAASSAYPRVHGCWTSLLSSLFGIHAGGSSDNVNDDSDKLVGPSRDAALRNLWDAVVGGELLRGQSREKKALALVLTADVVRWSTSKAGDGGATAKIVLGGAGASKVAGCLTSNAKHQASALHAEARRCAREMCSCCVHGDIVANGNEDDSAMDLSVHGGVGEGDAEFANTLVTLGITNAAPAALRRAVERLAPASLTPVGDANMAIGRKEAPASNGTTSVDDGEATIRALLRGLLVPPSSESSPDAYRRGLRGLDYIHGEIRRLPPAVRATGASFAAATLAVAGLFVKTPAEANGGEASKPAARKRRAASSNATSESDAAIELALLADPQLSDRVREMCRERSLALMALADGGSSNTDGNGEQGGSSNRAHACDRVLSAVRAARDDPRLSLVPMTPRACIAAAAAGGSAAQSDLDADERASIDRAISAADRLSKLAGEPAARGETRKRAKSTKQTDAGNDDVSLVASARLCRTIAVQQMMDAADDDYTTMVDDLELALADMTSEGADTLARVCVALLERPSAAVRGAVELAWKLAVVPRVSAAGVAAVVDRACARSLVNRRGVAETAEDGDDDDEDVDDEEDDDDEAEEDDEDEEDEGDEDMTANDAHKSSDDDGGGSDSDNDDDGLDDDAMMRMDGMLAAAFKARSGDAPSSSTGGAGRSSRAVRILEDVHARGRVLSLLTNLTGHHVAGALSPLVVCAARTEMEAVQAEGRGAPRLASALRELVNRLDKSLDDLVRRTPASSAGVLAAQQGKSTENGDGDELANALAECAAMTTSAKRVPLARRALRVVGWLLDAEVARSCATEMKGCDERMIKEWAGAHAAHVPRAAEAAISVADAATKRRGAVVSADAAAGLVRRHPTVAASVFSSQISKALEEEAGTRVQSSSLRVAALCLGGAAFPPSEPTWADQSAARKHRARIAKSLSAPLTETASGVVDLARAIVERWKAVRKPAVEALGAVSLLAQRHRRWVEEVESAGGSAAAARDAKLSASLSAAREEEKSNGTGNQKALSALAALQKALA